MTPVDFFLAISFSGTPLPDAQVLHDVVARVLAHAGSSGERVEPIAARIEQAVCGAGQATCDVSFAAHDGSLDVDVSANGSRLWQTSEHLC